MHVTIIYGKIVNGKSAHEFESEEERGLLDNLEGGKETIYLYYNIKYIEVKIALPSYFPMAVNLHTH